MDRSKELIKPVNMVLKAKKTLSNSRQGDEKHEISRKMSWGIFLKMDLVLVRVEGRERESFRAFLKNDEN